MPVPIEFLFDCSRSSLEDLELAKLNLAANLRKQMHKLELAIREAETEALLANWLAVHRDEILELCHTGSLQKSLNFIDGTVPGNT